MFLVLETLEATKPNVYVRQGRLVAQIEVGVNFWVDKNGIEEKNYKCETCELAYASSVSVFLSISLDTTDEDNKSILHANIIDVDLITLS